MNDPQIKVRRDDHGAFFEIRSPDSKRPVLVRVDFTPRKNIGGRSDLLARALGYKRGHPLRVLDATAGLCRDSFHFYSLGCEVLAVEKNPEIFSVISEYVKPPIDTSRFKLRCGDAITLLPKLTHEFAPDVIFLDPIFQEKKKTAQASKESRLLRELVPPPSAEEEFALLQSALQSARARVVVKRALHAPPLNDEAARENLCGLIKSRHSIKGKAVRYDVYIVEK